MNFKLAALTSRSSRLGIFSAVPAMEIEASFSLYFCYPHVGLELFMIKWVYGKV